VPTTLVKINEVRRIALKSGNFLMNLRYFEILKQWQQIILLDPNRETIPNTPSEPKAKKVIITFKKTMPNVGGPSLQRGLHEQILGMLFSAKYSKENSIWIL
jgi:hypothetical protein